MFPAAYLADHITHGTVIAKFSNPPLLARVGVAMTYALVAALGSYYVFRVFGLFYELKTAFLLSLIFSIATIYSAYAKSAWDVMGSCLGVSVLLYFAAIAVTRPAIEKKTIAGLALGLVIAGAFRFSLLPFLTLSTGAVLCFVRHKLTFRSCLVGATVFLIGLLPTLIYNDVRMGSPFRPATTAPQFASANGLTGSIWRGLPGLIASPNRGLLEFAPVFLLLLFVPCIWRTLSFPIRLLISTYGIGSLLYMCLIAKIVNWGAFGWGPRYLLPLMPVLFFMVAIVIVHYWQKQRTILLILIGISFLLNIAPVFVNWHLATTQYPHSTDAYARMPYQQFAVWHGLTLAMAGKPLPAPPEVLADPVRRNEAKFPDLWTVRLMEVSPRMQPIGGGLTIILMFIVLYCGRYLLLADSKLLRQEKMAVS